MRIECGSRGLDYDGLRKQELIELLRRDDALGEVEGSQGNLDPGALESDDEEIVLGGNQCQEAGVDAGNLMLNPADGTEESGSVTTLQLQLALVQAQTTLKERERERERAREGASGAYAAWERGYAGL